MGIVCKLGQTVNGLDTQIGLVEAGLGVTIFLATLHIRVQNRESGALS